MAGSSPHLPALSDSARAAAVAEVSRQLKVLADTLQLSQAQRDQVRPIVLENAYQLRQLRMKYAAMDRTPANFAAMQKEAGSLRESSDAKMSQVLSAEQMAKYKKWREDMMSRARARLGAADSTAKTHP